MVLFCFLSLPRKSFALYFGTQEENVTPTLQTFVNIRNNIYKELACG